MRTGVKYAICATAVTLAVGTIPVIGQRGQPGAGAGAAAGGQRGAPPPGAGLRGGQPPARGAQPQQQQPETPARPTFRAGVEAVQLDLRVLDRRGNFVSDLARDEFRIFEDGVEQTLTNFELVDIPIEPPDLTLPNQPIIDRDVATNVQPQGRLYMIVLDDLEDQVMNPLRSQTVRDIAREFIEHGMNQYDRAALVTTSGRRDMALEFTSNRQRLIDAANKYQGGYGQQMFAPAGLGGAGGMVADNLHSTMTSLTSIAKWLTQIDGRRKSIVMVSERLGRAMSPFGDLDFAVASGEAQDVKEFVTASARGNVSLYVLDPIGVPGGRSGNIRPIAPEPDIDSPAAFDNARIMSLVTLAEATGGFAAVRSNDFTAAVDRIVHESSSYYLLGYISSNPRSEGKFRKVDVRTTRPDLTVHARSGYVEPKGNAAAAREATASRSGLPPAVAELLSNPLGVSGLGLTISAPVFRGPSNKGAAVVVVETGADRLLFSEGSSRFNAAMTLVIAAADQSGKIQAGERGALTMRLSPQTRAAVAERGARVVSQLELKPGRYQLKVAAVDSSDGTTKGSVLYDLDVPDYSKAPLSLSGVSLSSPGEPPVPTVARDPKLKDLIGDLPTARREFSPREELRLYVEAYDNDKRPHTVAVTTTVRAASGNSVFSRRVMLANPTTRNGSQIHPMTTNIPLGGMAAGAYTLTITAESTNSADKPVTRTLPFSVK